MLGTDQATNAVTVLQTTNASQGAGIADLTGRAVVVASTTGSAGPFFTKKPAPTLFVFGTSSTLVLFANLALLTIGRLTTCRFGAASLQTEFTGLALRVGHAHIASTTSTDFSIATVRSTQTFHAGQSLGVATCASIASIVIAASFGAGTILTEATFRAVGICGASLTATLFAHKTSWARSGVGANGRNTSFSLA